jgi:tetratricopeptide (TPR) repeat protein
MFIKKQFRGITIITLFIFTCFTLTLEYSYSQEENPLLKAHRLYNQGNSIEAVKVLELFIEKTKGNQAELKRLAEAYYLLALMYYDTAADVKMIENMKRAVEADIDIGKEETNLNFKTRLELVREERIKSEAEIKETELAATKEKTKSDTAQTSVQEKEKPAPQLKKKKKLPFLLALFSVGVIAGLIVLLSKKKKIVKPEVNYTLTVTKGTGVEGTPESGIYTYSKGSAINYNYVLQSGYKDLVVKLDGATVPANGSITMNSNHSLEIPSPPFSVQPVPWNGHYYLVIKENIDWTTARERAEKIYYNGNYGHLATLTSQAENSFVASLIGENRAWLGGHQPTPQPNPSAGWVWVTGEIWSYTDWAAGEPNGFGKSENALSFVGGRYGLWNDRKKDEQLPNFVVEFK